MDDLYQYLISGAPNQAQIPAVVEQLRRRRALGELGALTGDRVLSPFGSSMVKQADRYAGDLQDIRQKDADNTRAAEYQQGMLGHQDAVLKATLARDARTAEYQRQMAEAARMRAQAAIDAARAKANAPGKIAKLRQGDIKDLQDMAATINGITDIEAKLNEGVKLGSKEFMGRAIPGSRTLANAMAAIGYGSQEDKDSFSLHQQWDRIYNLAERNKLFGATLSNNEQKAWAAANPNGNMTDEQIRAALPVIKKVYDHRRQQKVKGLTTEGYNPQAIAEYADVEGVNLPGGDVSADAADPSDADVADFEEAYQQNPKAAIAAWQQAFPNTPVENFIPAE